MDVCSQPTIADKTIVPIGATSRPSIASSQRDCPASDRSLGVFPSVEAARPQHLESIPSSGSEDPARCQTNLWDQPRQVSSSSQLIDNPEQQCPLESAPLRPWFVQEGGPLSDSGRGAPQSPPTKGLHREERLYDKLERTYADIAVNMGAIRQISTKKMKIRYVFSRIFSLNLLYFNSLTTWVLLSPTSIFKADGNDEVECRICEKNREGYSG